MVTEDSADRAEGLIDEAWRLIDSLVKTGKAQLADATPLEVKDQDLVRLLQWLAALKVPKKKAVPIPEDFKLRKTTQHGA